MSTPKLSLELSKDEFIQIYKACEDRTARLDALQNKSQDEDVIADAGNDLIELNMVKRFLQAKADELWGTSGWTTSEEFL